VAVRRRAPASAPAGRSDARGAHPRPGNIGGRGV
jgi:hypothetical protein